MKVKKAREITYWNGGQGMVAELESREEKREVMWRKKSLEKRIYIDNDLTKEERERRQKIRRKMAEMRRGDRSSGGREMDIGESERRREAAKEENEKTVKVEGGRRRKEEREDLEDLEGTRKKKDREGTGLNDRKTLSDIIGKTKL